MYLYSKKCPCRTILAFLALLKKIFELLEQIKTKSQNITNAVAELEKLIGEVDE